MNTAESTKPLIPLADHEIADLLQRTSRTFALCIPMLPQSLHRQVGIAYLLFRVADTIEDSTELRKPEKMNLLDLYCRTLESAQVGNASWARYAAELVQHAPTKQADDADLFRETARVITTAIRETSVVRKMMLTNVRKSSYGMRNYVASGSVSGNIQIRSWTELRGYCYCVAGIVGEMLTELFLRDQPSLGNARQNLKSNASSFGEALQMVNILKDSDQDQQDGRRFVPPSVTRQAVADQARADLESAEAYIQALVESGADPGIVQFTRFPVMLAKATLARIEIDGPGSKVGRDEVSRILTEVGCGQLAAAVNDQSGGPRR